MQKDKITKIKMKTISQVYNIPIQKISCTYNELEKDQIIKTKYLDKFSVNKKLKQQILNITVQQSISRNIEGKSQDIKLNCHE